MIDELTLWEEYLEYINELNEEEGERGSVLTYLPSFENFMTWKLAKRNAGEEV